MDDLAKSSALLCAVPGIGERQMRFVYFYFQLIKHVGDLAGAINN